MITFSKCIEFGGALSHHGKVFDTKVGATTNNHVLKNGRTVRLGPYTHWPRPQKVCGEAGQDLNGSYNREASNLRKSQIEVSMGSLPTVPAPGTQKVCGGFTGKDESRTGKAHQIVWGGAQQ